MRLLVLAAALLLPAIASAAPFCAVDNYGNEQCFYYTMDSCRDAVRYSGGACAYKSEQRAFGSDAPAPRVDPQSYDFGGAIMRGMEAGRESRRKRELHDLEVARRQAEIAVLQAQIAPSPAYDYTPASSSPPVPYSEDKRTLFYQCDALARYAAQMKKGAHKAEFAPARAEFEACRSVYETRYPGDQALR